MIAPARVSIPRTALSVSPLCLGGNRLGGQLDQGQSFALLDAFVEAGGNFIDTAHVYADWLPGVERSCSEKTIGRWLAARGIHDGIIVATKIGHPSLEEPGRSRLDRMSLRQDVVEAIECLRLDRLDLVYLHRDDPKLPAEEVLGALEELRGEGRIGHYAASNWTGERLEAASAAAQHRGWEGFRANQAEWCLASRNAGTAAPDLYATDSAMIAWHLRTGTAAIPYSAQARGYFDKLAGRALDEVTARNYDNPLNRKRGARLTEFAGRYGLTPTEAMLGLFRLLPFPVIPVVGCRDAAQIASSFRGISAAFQEGDAEDLLAELGFPSLLVFRH